MTPDLVLFLIRAGMQVGSEAINALEQKVRDADIEVPDIALVRVSEMRRMLRLFQGELAAEVKARGPLAAFWDRQAQNGKGGPRTADPQAVPRLLARARRYWREQREAARANATTAALEKSDAEAGANILRQWNDADGPPPPVVRVALSLARVGLAFAQANPAVLGIGSNGEKFALAVAEHIEDLLPDADDPGDWKPKDWSRYYFAERTLSILMHAGLTTLSARPDLLVSEAHLEQLVANVTAPLITLFDDSDDPLTLLRLQQTLLGPVAQAAFATLADNQRAFLGRRFESDRAVGGVTAAVLGIVRGKALQELADDGTLVEIARAAIGVAAKRPELFITKAGESDEKIARALLTKVAGAVSDAIADDNVHLSDGLVTDIAVSALEVLAEEGPSLLERTDPWENVAADMVALVAGGLSTPLGRDGTNRFEQLFSRAQAVELVRIVLAQAARTPGMLTGSGRQEIGMLMSAVASAMAADERLLLGPGDWQRIAGIVAREAARNPQRLFKLSVERPDGQLGTRIIRTILVAAADGLAASGPRGGALSFGALLVDAVEFAYRAAVGNLNAAAAAVLAPDAGGEDGDFQALGNLVKGINDFASRKPDEIGWREWRWLFINLVVDAIENGSEFTITEDALVALLSKSRSESELAVMISASES
ncbi:MAG: hypothetical protein BMS9Abin01_2347 [Gammaproteobacteria bacterium]|nr:MAG: hypothetical protein BMS9Abin01_2347 [Gammaproteobacteria bacterium]